MTINTHGSQSNEIVAADMSKILEFGLKDTEGGRVRELAKVLEQLQASKHVCHIGCIRCYISTKRDQVSL